MPPSVDDQDRADGDDTLDDTRPRLVDRRLHRGITGRSIFPGRCRWPASGQGGLLLGSGRSREPDLEAVPGATARNLSMSSGVGATASPSPSSTARPTSRKNRSNPAGVTTISIRAGRSPTFL